MTEKTVCLIAFALTGFVGFCLVRNNLNALGIIKDMFLLVVGGLIGYLQKSYEERK
jgi:hypothetical protein